MFRYIKPIPVSLFALFVAGCGSRIEPTDTSTSWLATCASSSECSGSFSCICGVCTLECDEDSQCASASESAVCRPPNGECSATASLCLRAPEESKDGSTTPPPDLDAGTPSNGGSIDASFTDTITLPAPSGMSSFSSPNSSTDVEPPNTEDTSATNPSTATGDGSAPLPPAEICDGSDDIRFVYFTGIGFTDERASFYNEYGHRLLAIDGKCHFWAKEDGGLLLEGDLDAPELVTLQQAHYGKFGTYPKENSQCVDAGANILWDPYGSTVCWCECDSEEELDRTAAFSFAPTLLRQVLATGTPTTGDLRMVLLNRDSTEEGEGSVPWPLTFEQSSIAKEPSEIEWFSEKGTLFPSGADAQLLRGARTESGGATSVHFDYSPVVEAGAGVPLYLYTGYMRDEPPSKVITALETAQAENPWPEF